MGNSKSAQRYAVKYSDLLQCKLQRVDTTTTHAQISDQYVTLADINTAGALMYVVRRPG